MCSDFKELICRKPIEKYGESEALWFEITSESKKRWLREDVKLLLVERIKTIAEDALTEKQKRVFILFLNGKSQREIAAIFLPVIGGFDEVLIKSRKNIFDFKKEL